MVIYITVKTFINLFTSSNEKLASIPLNKKIHLCQKSKELSSKGTQCELVL